MPEPLSTLNQAFVGVGRPCLREAGIDTPELDARLLLCHAAGLSHEAYVAGAGGPLQPATLRALRRRDRRGGSKREPVARITGSREFYGRGFTIAPHDARPAPRYRDPDRGGARSGRAAGLARPDAQPARSRHRHRLHPRHPAGRAAARARARHRSQPWRARRLPPPMRCASVCGSRAAFMAADWLDGIDGKFDLVLSNPPYLASGEIAGLAPEVAAYDPMLALDGGADGLDAYRAHCRRRRPRSWPRAAGCSSRSAPAKQRPCRTSSAPRGLKLDPAQAIGRDLAGRPRVVVAACDSRLDRGVARPKKGLENRRCSG